MANGVVLGHLFMAGRYEEVLVEGAAMERLLPPHATIGNFQASALWELQRYDEAVAKYAEIAGPDHPFVKALERGLTEGGPRTAMRLNAERLAAMQESSRVRPSEVARYFAQAGDLDSAFVWLERAFDARTPLLLHVNMDPRFAEVRADPRYEDLLRRIGFPNPGASR
jgi:hypothetical protein